MEETPMTDQEAQAVAQDAYEAALVEIEADCCHADCTDHLAREAQRIGLPRAAHEQICLILEREDDEYAFNAGSMDLYEMIEGDRR
jgi:hypothetical protein